MAPFPVETGRLVGRQFPDVGGVVNQVTDVATGAGGAVTNAANTVADVASNAAGTAADVAQDVGGEVVKGVKTGVEAIKSAAEAIAELAHWMDQIKALLEAWEKYKDQIYIAAVIIIALIIIMFIISCYTCCKCCWSCCCRHEEHDHDDQKAACWGLCGGSANTASTSHENLSPPEVVAPKREPWLGGLLNVDRSYIARGFGKRLPRDGEHWNTWGLVGRKGHGSWFNVQREKDWFPRWLGGRGKGQDWSELSNEVTGLSKVMAERGRGAANAIASRARSRAPFGTRNRMAEGDDGEKKPFYSEARAARKNPDNTARFQEEFDP